jgi:hypothetical protein
MALSTWLQTRDPRAGAVAALVSLTATAPAFMLAVLLHELAHAVTAVLLGQTVTRVLVGEGVAWQRLGRDPQLVIGSVPLGNGLTTVLDLRRTGYRWRLGVMSMTAPMASAGLAFATYLTTTEWPFAARTAALLFALANAVMAVITLIPVPTFGGRIWSDLAATLYLARADDQIIEQHMLQSVQDRMAILIDVGLFTRAIETARAAVDLAPSTFAQSLLAYALHRDGQHREAATVARAALARDMDDGSREYLQRFLDESS